VSRLSLSANYDSKLSVFIEIELNFSTVGGPAIQFILLLFMASVLISNQRDSWYKENRQYTLWQFLNVVKVQLYLSARGHGVSTSIFINRSERINMGN